ncbi:MAG TPA: DUF1015 domain-containing protein [Actinomycetes bacterium]|nr:DUF1015 domain-containing protein [Actinomycetes bacterium]
MTEENSPTAESPALSPFRATRYADVDLAAVTSPPYDVVEPDRFARLEAADPHNVVRLILPRDEEPGDRYRHAAAVWQDWHADKILAVDDTAALWIYEQTIGGSALVGVVGTVPVDRQSVLPHEDVMPGPVLDRADLMSAVNANLEPILLVHDPGSDGSSVTHRSATTQLIERVRNSAPPIIDLRTDDGAHHRLWPLYKPSQHELVAQDLATRSVLIADGHHRFAAYQRIRAGRDAGPWERGLAMVVDGREHPLALGAIHRTIRGLDVATASARLGAGLQQMRLDNLAAAQHFLAEPAEQSRLVVSDGDVWLGVASADPEVVPRPDRTRAWRALPTALLHELLIPQRWQVDERHVAYHHDVEGAMRSAGQRCVAVLVPTLTLPTVIELASLGERLPRKSTSFGPKPRTGLLMWQFDSG